MTIFLGRNVAKSEKANSYPSMMDRQTLRLPVLVFVFLLAVGMVTACSSSSQSDVGAPSNLDQLKLMQTYVGMWQRNIGNDTVDVWEVQQYGNAFISTAYRVINGTKSFIFAENWGFSSEENKFRGFTLLYNGIITTWIASFTTEKRWIGYTLVNFNPKQVTTKFELTLETPTKIIAVTFDRNGVKTREVEWSKIK